MEQSSETQDDHAGPSTQQGQAVKVEDVFKSQLDGLHARVSDLQMQIDSLNATTPAKLKERVDAEQRIKAIDQRIRQLEQERMDAENEKARLADQVAKSMALDDDAVVKLASLEKKRDAILGKVKALMEALDSSSDRSSSPVPNPPPAPTATDSTATPAVTTVPPLAPSPIVPVATTSAPAASEVVAESTTAASKKRTRGRKSGADAQIADLSDSQSDSPPAKRTRRAVASLSAKAEVKSPNDGQTQGQQDRQKTIHFDELYGDNKGPYMHYILEFSEGSDRRRYYIVRCDEHQIHWPL